MICRLLGFKLCILCPIFFFSDLVIGMLQQPKILYIYCSVLFASDAWLVILYHFVLSRFSPSNDLPSCRKFPGNPAIS